MNITINHNESVANSRTRNAQSFPYDDLGCVIVTQSFGVCKDCKEWSALYRYTDRFGDDVYLCKKCYTIVP